MTEPINLSLIMGSYEGTSPGTNSLIKTTITLKNDMTYTKDVEYLDKGDKIFSQSGIYTSKNGIITLDDTDGAHFYQIKDNALLQLDMDGNVIEGEMAEMFVLNKL